MPTQIPIAMLSYAALGAFVHWMVLKYGRSPERGVEQLVDDILGRFSFRAMLSMIIFVAIGSVLSIVMVEPTTSRQALAGGMAWTTLMGNGAGTDSKRRKTDVRAP